ncbi:MAG TPA: hypothetical protein VHS31_18570 [Tepidisphaeraceae bacterium]|jgi:hypothetical protein|nr:hypothetical protein [Tepidisphaeraceae bacterium]
MNRLATLLILTLPAITFGATTQPAATQSIEQQLAGHKQQEQQEYLKGLDGLPELKLPNDQISDIFVLSIENDNLAIDPKLDKTELQMQCHVKGLVGPCSVFAFTERNAPDGGIMGLQFSHRDFSRPDEIFRQTMLFGHADSLQISMDLDGLVQSKSVSLIEDHNPEDPAEAVRLTAELIDPATDELLAQYTLAAPTFRELRHRYPRQTQEFVVPILRDLQTQTILAPDPHVACQVLQTQFKADEKLQKQINTALAKFDSDRFQDREQAAKDLDKLGEPAAMALMHANRQNWSIDRSSGVDAFLASYKPMTPSQIAELRDNPIFLLDCLYSQDSQTRSAAAKKLEDLSHIKIDPTLTGPARENLINTIYARIYKPLPATQP